MLQIADSINTIIQAVLLAYIPYYCIKKDGLIEGKKGKIKLITSIVVMLLSITILTNIMGGTSLSVISMNITCMLILVCFYIKNYEKIVISYAIAYLIFQMTAILFSNIKWSYIQGLVFIKNEDLSTLAVIYVPMILIEILVLLYVDKVYKLYKHISRKKYAFDISIIVTFSLDIILSLSLIIHGNDDVFFKNLFIIFLMGLLVLLFLYFINTKNKMDEISKLNKALQEKNNELKKIKHDYGSQISYINGLYIMEQYERLGSVLKDVISGNNAISDNLKILSNSESIISIILSSLSTRDVNVIVEEEYDISKLDVSEYDLQKVISNIVKNAVTAMDGNGLIVIKTYKIFSNVYINIKNDGPKIDDVIIDRIFEPGFTTKNSSDNGFGLAIVKEMVESNNGELTVSSNNDFTEFKIMFKVQK
ncbi:sensor histidine kinase [[Clostridium] dakarense]|uniref:sensor histidine kinase n=1 Tax=Faecalimicrobium dakarense TaxID=1301100 RepID=UPI0004B6E2F6|nr:ATP-binding protein [[Clostridium] dakarense]